MSEPQVAMLDIDAIEVEEGFNPRKVFDEQEMAELVKSIEEDGLTTPITVRPNGGSKHVLVAGERRLIAARKAGLKEVPGLIRAKDGAYAAAFAENEFRANLNPIERAEALKRLGSEEGLGTQKKLAERTGKSTAFISTHLRLLKLPVPVQRHIAEGTVSIEAERVLRQVAEASPRAAECMCELVAQGRYEAKDLLTDPDDILVDVSEGDFENPPTLIDPGAIALLDIAETEEELLGLREKLEEFFGTRTSDGARVVRFGDAEVDAARAAGCLLELTVDHEGWSSKLTFITDRTLAADLFERHIDRLVKQAEREKREREKEQQKGTSADGAAGKAADEEEKARAKEERKAAKAMAEATGFNEELGRKLVRRRGTVRAKEQRLRRAKALAAFAIQPGTGLSGGGLRLVLPQLREVRQPEGKKKPVISYATRQEATEYLLAKVESAGSEQQVIDLLVEALMAAFLADQEALAPHERGYGSVYNAEKVKELLEPDMKAVLPAGSGESE